MARLGIDVGGTKVALRCEAAGEPVRESVVRWPSGEVGGDLAVLGAAVGDLRAEGVTSVGVAMPALVDGAGRVETWPGRPTWEGLDLRQALGSLFPGARVRWADDGDLAALAEAAAAGVGDLVYLGVGTGLGGGIVRGGSVFPGPDRGSCEVGHLLIGSDAVCDCGRVGCLQATASGPATLRRAAVSYDELRSAFGAGEPWAEEVLGETADALATAVVTLTELARPDLAVIGGGFASGLPGFVDLVAQRVSRSGRPGVPAVPVHPAALGGLSSLDGALLLAAA